MHLNRKGLRQFSRSIKGAFGLEGQQPIALGVVSGVGRAVAAAEVGVAVNQVQVDAQPRPREFDRPVVETADVAAVGDRHRAIQLVGAVLEADADAEGLVAAQVGEQRAVALVGGVAESCPEAAAQQGQATEELAAVEGFQLWVAVMDHPQFIAQGLVEGLLETHVRIHFQVAGGADAHARRPLADVPAAVVGQVQAAVERTAAGRLDQALGHAAARRSAELEVEVAHLALEHLRIDSWAGQQGAGQQKRGFEHAALHEQRGAGTVEPTERRDLDVCKHTDERCPMRAVRRFLQRL